MARRSASATSAFAAQAASTRRKASNSSGLALANFSLRERSQARSSRSVSGTLSQVSLRPASSMPNSSN